MRALCWNGVNRLSVENVDEPRILNAHDVILRVRVSSACGSDLHLLDGYVPTVRPGDVIGHEFLGDVVETGADVRRHHVGDRVVVAPSLGCGRCWFCQRGDWSLCDNSNPTPGAAELAFGHAPAGVFGYSHAFGGFAGSHAEYVRVPFADHGAFAVPEGLSDEQALFTSDALPTGWMAADIAGIRGGDVVAVWGCGGVGLMAMRAAALLGAERVIGIDRVPERLAAAGRHTGADTIDYTRTDVGEMLNEMTGGRGPDVCVEAVGMESHGTGPLHAYDWLRQTLRLRGDRAVALRQAVRACRKGGTVSVAGVFDGVVDRFPMGAVLNKALTVRAGLRHSQRYIPMLLREIEAGRIDPSFLATHPLPLREGPRGYELFRRKQDGCLRPVFHPNR